MAEPLPKGACGWRRKDAEGSRCTEPGEYRIVYFHFDEGTDPSARRRGMRRCAKHLGQAIDYIARNRQPDKLVVYRNYEPTTEEDL